MAGDQELDQAKEKVEKAVENPKEETQTDIEKMQAAVETLRSAGGDLFKQQIKEIESNIEVEQQRVTAQAEAIKKAAEEVADKAQTTVTNKYGEKVWEILKAVALIAIIYGIFGR